MKKSTVGKVFLATVAVAALAAPFVKARPIMISAYVTRTEQMSEALKDWQGYPIVVAVGRGYKAAPLEVRLQCMTPDTRADWYDKHVDLTNTGRKGGCVDVIVLQDTSRVNAIEWTEEPTPSTREQ